MATRTESIASLLNQIRADHQLVLPDLQRDFVWKPEQITLLMDSLMREYPFGSLLFWQTRYLEIRYREFVKDFTTGQTFAAQTKPANRPLKMVLDGQQRLQSLFIAVYGSLDRRRLYFNVASGPGGAGVASNVSDDGIEAAYRFEFWHDEAKNRPKRLVSVGDIVGWTPRSEDAQIDRVVADVGLDGEDAARARRNMRLLRQTMNRGDLVPIETIDEEAVDQASARTIDEILEIFVRVNSGGTRLSRSDLMFSLLKSVWGGARGAFDELVRDVERIAPLGVDKDFVIRGLLMALDAPMDYAVANVRKHDVEMERIFDKFATALRATIDFCRSPDIGLGSKGFFEPLATIYPIAYAIYHYGGSVPEAARRPLKTLLYFLLFNGFVKSEPRIRYLRTELMRAKGKLIPLDALLKVIAQKQTHTHLETTAAMLQEWPQLALNIVQPQVARETLGWQEKPEVDHVFPQARFRETYPKLIDDIGNLAFLGKLRNIRKSKDLPEEYFADVSDEELRASYLICDRTLLRAERFPDFVESRRAEIVRFVRAALGR